MKDLQSVIDFISNDNINHNDSIKMYELAADQIKKGRNPHEVINRLNELDKVFTPVELPIAWTKNPELVQASKQGDLKRQQDYMANLFQREIDNAAVTKYFDSIMTEEEKNEGKKVWEQITNKDKDSHIYLIPPQPAFMEKISYFEISIFLFILLFIIMFILKMYKND